MPDLDKYAYPWEKQLLADHERNKEFNKGFEQGVFTSLAVTYNILLFHYKEMANVKRRVQVFEMYFNTLLEKVQTPDEEQQFAEWYYQECTGYEMLRKENQTMANKQAKINIGEIVSRKISDKGFKNAEVAQGINKSVGLINNLRYGQASKKTLDEVMKFLGEELTPGEMAVYKEAYGVGNNDTSRFEAMEARIIEHEATEAPAVEDEEHREAIPVPEDLPFADCNDMYKEVESAPNVIDVLNAQIENYRIEMSGVEATIEDMLKQVEVLKERKANLDVAIGAINVSINVIKEAGV